MAWANRDAERYRAGYPDAPRDPAGANQNLLFYSNQLKSRPSGDLVDDMHKRWTGDYGLLERHHGWVQWAFPIREHGVNSEAQPLTVAEMMAFRESPAIQARVLRSFQMILDFWGFVLLLPAPPALNAAAPLASAASAAGDAEADAGAGADAAADADSEPSLTPALSFSGSNAAAVFGTPRYVTVHEAPVLSIESSLGGTVQRKPQKFEGRFSNLNTSSHNYLRVTRVLKFLGEVGFEHLKQPFVLAMMGECFGPSAPLRNMRRSLGDYFISVLRDDAQRAYCGTRFDMLAGNTPSDPAVLAAPPPELADAGARKKKGKKSHDETQGKDVAALGSASAEK